MITVLRDYFKRGSQIILWIVIGAFVVGFLPMAFRGTSGSTPWAMRINGQEVSALALAIEQGHQQEQLMAVRQQYGEYADLILSMMGIKDPQQEAIKKLQTQELLNQFADSLGIQISPDFIAKRLNDPSFVAKSLTDVIPPYIVDPVMGINHAMLSRYLKHTHMTVDMFEQQIERALLERLIIEFVATTLYIPEFDIKQKYMLDFAKKSFSVLSFELKDFLAKEKENKVSEADLKKFYDEQNNATKRYWVPEKRSGELWTFTPKAYNITISDEVIKEYYDTNKLKQFIDKPAEVEVRALLVTVPDVSQRASKQEKAARLKDEIMQDPSQFAAIAKRSSDDKETADKGGLIKPFSRGTHETSFDRAAFLLPEDGAVSDVIETSRGFEILQRVKKTAPQFKPLSAVRKEIESNLKEQQFSKRFATDIRKVIDNEKALASFIAERGGSAKKLSKVGAEENPHLFKLQEGQKTFFVDGSEGVAVRLDSIQKRYLPALETIKSTVIADFHEKSARDKLAQKLSDAKNAFGKSSIKELQKSMGGSFSQTGMIDLSDKEAAEKLTKQELPVPRMLQMEKAGEVIAHSEGDRGFVVKLNEIEPFNAEKFEEKKAEIARVLEEQRLSQYLKGFVASLHRNAKIETNESVITLQ